jgi:hypothetical protein
MASLSAAQLAALKYKPKNKGRINHSQQAERGDYDDMLLNDNFGLPYMPQQVLIIYHSSYEPFLN